MNEFLVIGFGSIGARHARLAREDGHRVTVVSRRDATGDFPRRATVREAIAAGPDFHFAVVASETGQHAKDVEELLSAGFKGRVLVEKPLFAGSAESARLARTEKERIYVAYNLRFHPLLMELRERLRSGGKILSAVAHVGQNLNQWRSGRPLDQTYSSQRSRGGGVLRDLSHELDYLIWLLGPCRAVAAMGGRLGDLTGDADDCWGVLLHFESGVIVTLAMDYFCQVPIRAAVFNTATDTLHLDLIRGALTDVSGETTVSLDRDSTYREQLRALVAHETRLCSFDEGLQVLRLIEAIEESSVTGAVVSC